MGALKIKFRAQAILVGCLVFIALALINVLIHQLSLRFDLTQDKEYTLSEATKNLLKSLDDTVTIKLYFSSDAPSRISPVLDQVRDLIDEYSIKGSSKINVQHVDPASSPESEQETQMLGIPPLQLNVIEKDKAEVRKIYLGIGLYYADKKEIIPVVSNPANLEYEVTAAILKLTTKELPKVGVIKFGEDYSLIDSILGRQMTLIPLELSERDLVAKKLDALVIVNPINASADFVKQVDMAFEANVPILIFSGGIQMSPQLQGTMVSSGFEDWLKERGIEIIAPLVIDPQYVGRAAFSSGVVQYQLPYPFFVHVPQAGLNHTHPITSKLENILMPWTSSIKIENKPDYQYTNLIESSGAALLQEGEPLATPQILESLNFSQGSKKVLALEASQGNKKLILVSNATFARDNFLNDFEGNLIFFQNAIDYATRGDALIGIRSRGKTLRPLPVFSSGTIELIRWSHLILSPLLFLGAGYLIRRRHTKALSNLANSLI